MNTTRRRSLTVEPAPKTPERGALVQCCAWCSGFVDTRTGCWRCGNKSSFTVRVLGVSDDGTELLCEPAGGMMYMTRRPEDWTEEESLIHDLFVQGCARSDGKYSHDFISTYEEAQAFLIERNIIAPEKCVYE